MNHVGIVVDDLAAATAFFVEHNTAEPNAPANTPGRRRIMFAVDNIDEVLA